MTLFSLLRPNTSGPYADIANAYIAHNLWPFPFPLQLLLIHAKRGGRCYSQTSTSYGGDLFAGAGDAEIPAEALQLLEERKSAKAARDWARADAIRDQLAAMGFKVLDTGAGAKLERL